MGTVELVFDRARSEHLARKRFRRESPLALASFKTEFRALERLRHRNLTRVYELSNDEHGPFFTMEFVDGAPLDEHCVGARRTERVLDALRQLLDALTFLHAQGVIHRDLKPHNILVRRDEVVKLLDFGVLAELTTSGTSNVVAGTPGYMAPEQLRGETPTAASDVYSLGVTLFEIMAGRRPFLGSYDEVLTAHREDPAPRLSDLMEVDETLDALCAAMLDKSPQRRISISGIRHELGMDEPVHDGGHVLVSELVGRQATLGRLLDGWLYDDSSPRTCVLSGPTGVGKTALATKVAENARESGYVVLWGTARPTERIAFNALDGAIDDLAELLATRRPDTEALTQCLERVASAFPVLARDRQESFVSTREEVRRRLFDMAPSARPALPRSAVFDAVIELARWVSSTGKGILLVVDDIQWGDDDSLALLAHWLKGTGRELRTLLALRDDAEPNPAVDYVGALEDSVVVEVPPLEPEIVEELIRRAAGVAGTGLSAQWFRGAAQLASGRPYLALVTGWALASGAHLAEDVSPLHSLIRTTKVRERTVLGMLVALDHWTGMATLAELLDASPGSVERDVDRLERLGLVRRGARTEEETSVELYHDGVRTGALAVLGEDAIQRAHRCAADLLRGRGQAGSPELVRHLMGAGLTREAAREAPAAARAAEAQRAFALAADLYGIAFEHGGSDATWLEARAFALERAGKYEEATTCWSALVDQCPERRRTDVRIHQAHALIAANRTAQGLDCLDAILRETGQPTTTRTWTMTLSAVGKLLAGAVGLPARKRGSLDSSGLAGAERNVKIAILLCFLDPLMGLHYMQQAQAGFERAGQVELTANCDYLFAVLAHIGSRQIDHVWLADRYRRAAERRLAGRAKRAEVRGMPFFLDGLGALRRGQWDDARDLLDQAAEIFTESDGTTERVMATSWSMMTDVYRQDLAAMNRHLRQFRANANEEGAHLVVAHVDLLAGYILHLEGRFEEATHKLDEVAAFGEGRPNVQGDAGRMYRYMTGIYVGDPREMREGFAMAEKAARRHGFFRTLYAGPLASIGALLEANALRAGDPGARRSRVERFARIVDDSPPLAAGVSHRARAYAAEALGHASEAEHWLEVALEEGLRTGRLVDTEIARYQLGLRRRKNHPHPMEVEARERIAALGAAPAVLEEDYGYR